MFNQQTSSQVTENTKKKITRAAVSAADIAPLVRPMVGQEFIYHRSSERVARSHGIGRLAVIECGFDYQESRLAAIERRLGIFGGNRNWGNAA